LGNSFLRRRLASALEKKKSQRPKPGYELELLSEAQACFSQHVTPRKVNRSLLGAFEQPEDQNFVQTQSRHTSRPKTSPWRSCLLLSVTFGVLAGFAAVLILPATPRVLPLIY